MFFPVGKLPIDILDRMLKAYAPPGENIIVGPSIGEDATVIDRGEKYLLVKTDPITFVAEDIGTYTININANDIATMGGVPLWFLTTILLPEKHTTPELVEEVFQQLSHACQKIGVSLCGGHTEITSGVDRPIVIGVMLGEVEKDALITTSGAKAGDDILLTKAIAIEGTSIIAREKAEELKGIFGEGFVKQCKRFIEEPGISVLKDAEIARQCGEIHCMHDPTEGGLATGLLEIAVAANKGLIIEEESIPVLKECQTLCQHYRLDPLGLIASGTLLITLNPEDTEQVLKALKSRGISATRIGRVLPKEDGLKMKRGNQLLALPRFNRDEITKIF
jgi:hydrogenase maturation factor